MSSIKLFCIPYAGGTAIIYESWKRRLGESIELIPLELKGRGSRGKEKFYNNFDEAVDDLYDKIKSVLKREDCYAIFGHSMGALIAYELTHKLTRNNYKEPMHLFLSGRYPPHIKKSKGMIRSKSDEELIQAISELNPDAKEIYENKKWAGYFLTIIRSDFEMLESYEFTPSRDKLNCKISLLNGNRDIGVGKDEVKEWDRYTNETCTFYEFNGGHFFINYDARKIIEIINSSLELSKVLP